MSKKDKKVFRCQQCGYEAYKWMGKCSDCNAWNSFIEEQATPRSRQGSKMDPAVPQPISQVDDAVHARLGTGINELDRVLGGGVVPGSLILLGGDPGIGKSTLLLQALGALAKNKRRCLYVSGEESAGQIRGRAGRLNVVDDHILLLGETCLELIMATIKSETPDLVILDSIQTVYSSDLESAPGSLSQGREVAVRVMNLAKQSGIPVVLVGHVTKDGNLAGPKALEHLVDTVLYLEGEKAYPYRILRAAKNRFGSTHEIGVFEMLEGGLKEVSNPSQFFLDERSQNASGSAVVATVEGARPLLVEIQALVSATHNPGIPPRRQALGIDGGRLSLLVAVLEKRLGCKFYDQDIFVNVIGGLKIIEPAVDLAVVAALLSGLNDITLDPHTLFFGEIGLGGELRGISRADLRFKEAARLGFKRCICPKRNADENREKGIQAIGIDHLDKISQKIA